MLDCLFPCDPRVIHGMRQYERAFRKRRSGRRSSQCKKKASLEADTTFAAFGIFGIIDLRSAFAEISLFVLAIAICEVGRFDCWIPCFVAITTPRLTFPLRPSSSIALLN